MEALRKLQIENEFRERKITYNNLVKLWEKLGIQSDTQKSKAFIRNK